MPKPANKKMTGIPWPVKQFHYKQELEDRAARMGISEAKYCRMILIRHIKSGEKIIIEG